MENNNEKTIAEILNEALRLLDEAEMRLLEEVGTEDSKRRMLYAAINNLRIAGSSIFCAETHLKQSPQQGE